MSLINEGLNRPANFEGSIGASQEERHKLNQKERKDFEESRLKFEIEPQEFPDLVRAMHTDTQQLSITINALMRAIFADYYGCKIEITNNRALLASIYFSEEPSHKNTGKYNGIERIVNKSTLNNAEGRIEALNQFSAFGRRNVYKITKEADQLLRDVIPNQFINKETLKVDWSKVTNEGSVQSNGIYQCRIYVQVMIDINKVLKILFGAGDENYEAQYAVQVGAPINPSMTSMGEFRSDKWHLLLFRSNSSAVRQLASDLGYNFGSSADLGIVTE